MAKLIETNVIKEQLSFYYSRKTTLSESKIKRKHNVESFLNIPHEEDLVYGKCERRILLYETLAGEKIYIQYPGKESAEKNPKPFDFRPELEKTNGGFMKPITFGHIWDILDAIREKHKDFLQIIASLLIRMGYMEGYVQTDDLCKSVKLDIEHNKLLLEDSVSIDWYKLDITDDIWYTLNNSIGEISITEDDTISFEGFIKYVDLLFQNEDCKYYYINKNVKGEINYNFRNGRNNSADSNLAVLQYLQGNKKLSTLLNEMQKGRGVTSFRKTDYCVVTNGMVINIDCE